MGDGSSVNFSVRLKAYYLKNLSKNNMLINKALIKYGYHNFSLEILEYCDPTISVSREQYYLDVLKPEYNILKIAGSFIGFKHSDKAKNLMATIRKGKIHSDETKAKIGAASLGRKHSQETVDKMSAAANKGEKNPMFGRPKPEGSGRLSQKISVVDLLTNETTKYDWLSEAAKALGIKGSRISMYLINNQKKPYKGRYIFVV